MRNLLFWVLSCLLFFGSCVSPEKLRREVVYFNEGLDTAKLNQYKLIEPIIQKGDLLQIGISSRSSSSNQLFNQNYSSSGALIDKGNNDPVASTSISVGNAPNVFLVDITTGEIKLPLLGVIKADGMSKLDLEKEIIKRASEYLKEDPIVNIRYLNFRITFHGSVNHPGSKIFSSERVTFLEALGEVGGIAPGGNLKNILIVREQNGKRTMHTVDLTKGDFFNSPNYYLKQNDIVYVSPTKRALIAMDQTSTRTFQFVNISFFAVNLIVTLISLFR